MMDTSQEKKKDEIVGSKSAHWKREAQRFEAIAESYKAHLVQFISVTNKYKAEIGEAKHTKSLDDLFSYAEMVQQDVINNHFLYGNHNVNKNDSLRAIDKESQFKKISEVFPGFFGLRRDTSTPDSPGGRPISPFSSTKKFFRSCFYGPESEQPDSFADIASAQSISTYPHLPIHEKREGDPICDRYSVHVYDTHIIATIADGCNWGVMPRDAAVAATNAFSANIKSQLQEVNEIKDIGPLLIKSMSIAHEAIVAGKELYDAGTTTLLGCVLFEKEGLPEWELVVVSVGDCKVFCKSGDDIVEITLNNRNDIYNASDCGGRLGPHMEGGHPDLRNLSIFSHHCKADDLIFLVTDGVHDNLDPQLLGIGPKALALEESDWKAVSHEKGRPAKNQFMMNLLEEKLHGVSTPREVVSKLIGHCVETTQSSRKWMEDNVGKRLANDYVNFPGKMDHTTAVCFKVGKIAASNQPVRNWKNKSSEISRGEKGIGIGKTRSRSGNPIERKNSSDSETSVGSYTDYTIPESPTMSPSKWVAWKPPAEN